MSDITIKRSHTLGFDRAKEITQALVAAVKQDFPSLVNDIKWNADKTAADVQGKGFTGRFSMSEGVISIDISLKFFAKPFKSKVEGKILKKLDEHFS
jgi:hypothetical protein